jgi:hypothetical protein
MIEEIIWLGSFEPEKLIKFMKFRKQYQSVIIVKHKA